MSAYIIFNNRVTDPDGMADYIPKAMETLAPYDPELLVLDEQAQVLEGTPDFPRMVVIKFKSRSDAEAWYNSAEYGEVRPLRLAATDGVGFLTGQWEAPSA
ncbi:MAG TPA: DUF1330 domain-containing protein [Aeromicrobium sp.]|nr:DUF1330 domain-containing protein [Aeromicrobium sp.]